MAQTIILPPGTGAQISTQVEVPSGFVVTVALYCLSDDPLPEGVTFNVMQKTPGESNYIDRLNNADRSAVLSGPGKFVITRPAYDGASFGAFIED